MTSDTLEAIRNHVSDLTAYISKVMLGIVFSHWWAECVGTTVELRIEISCTNADTIRKLLNGFNYGGSKWKTSLVSTRIKSEVKFITTLTLEDPTAEEVKVITDYKTCLFKP